MKRVVTKRILITLVLIIVLSLSVTAGLNVIGEASSSQLTAILQSQSPDPVEPGQILTVKFKIQNEARETTQDVIVKLKPSYPFSLHGDVAEKNIGKLRAISTGADAVVVTYKLKVDEAAKEGDTELELDLITGNSVISYDDDEFLIDLRSQDATLDISSIKMEPPQVAPGDTAKIHITIKNLADSLMKDIKLKLNFANGDLPLAPYQSSSERRLQNLKSGFQDSLTFTVIADPSATSGLYKVPLNITYNDNTGESFAIDEILAVTIGDTPKVQPFIKKSTVLKSGMPGKVTIGLANAGISDVKLLELHLLPSEDYQLITPSTYFYIGDIDSDDTESQEVDLYVNNGRKKLELPVKLKYYDANNKPFQQQFDLEMDLYSSFQLKRFGLMERSKFFSYLIFILIIVGGVYYYKNYYKQPNKKLSVDLKLKWQHWKKRFHRRKRKK